MILGLPFDEQKLLEETEDDNQSPFNLPENAAVAFSSADISMILPLDADGLLAEVANAFLEGFIHAAEDAGEIFSLEIYRTDGLANSELQAYRQATADGAGMIIGPILRTSVERIARLSGLITVPTILLQDPGTQTFAGQEGASLLYSFPLGAEPEIIQFANQAIGPQQIPEVYVLAENSALGDRLVKTFQRAWRATGAKRVNVRKVVAPEMWVGIHNELRNFLITAEERHEEAQEQRLQLSVPVEAEDEPPHPAVFAAGGSGFASQARANVPSALPIYTLAAVQADLARSGRNSLGLDGIRLFQMPYLLSLSNRDRNIVGERYARSLPPDLQRYFAFGLDAFAIAQGFPSWGTLDFWRAEGASGSIVLEQGMFKRVGVPLEIVSGVVTQLRLAEAEGQDSCVGNLAKCDFE